MDPTVADSLQAAQDTLVLVQAQSTSWLEWASFVVSLLIAGFTGGYLWYTMGIFEKTETQAEAAQESAEASQEAAEASQDSLEVQRRINKQRTLERTHPFLWLDVDSYNQLTSDALRGKLVNNSNLPAMDISLMVCARYHGTDYNWDELMKNYQLQDYFSGTDLYDKEGGFGFHIGLSTDAILASGKVSLDLHYPEPPSRIHTLLQYRSIHGTNFLRYYKAGPSSPLSPARVSGAKKYEILETTPKGIQESDRFRWYWRPNEDGLREEILLAEENVDREDWNELASDLALSEDSITSTVGIVGDLLMSSHLTSEKDPFGFNCGRENSLPVRKEFGENWIGLGYGHGQDE